MKHTLNTSLYASANGETIMISCKDNQAILTLITTIAIVVSIQQN